MDALHWRVKHRDVMSTVLRAIYLNTNGVILKGGTSLLYCYGLTRFSEDLDFDSEKVNLSNILKTVASNNNWTVRVAKETPTVKRYMLHYGGIKPLKVEVSYRSKNIAWEETCRIEGILTYNIRTLFNMKLQAYSFRDALRDLYDIVFIFKTYLNYLTKEDIARLANAFYYKDLTYVQGLLDTQTDELINNGVLEEEVIKMYYQLGLS